MEYLENPYYTLVVWNVDRREWFGAEVCRSNVGYLAMDKGNCKWSTWNNEARMYVPSEESQQKLD